MKHDVGAAAAQIGLVLSSDAIDALVRFALLLRERAAPRGFVGAADAEDILERHVLDSLRAATHVPTGVPTVDLGSGAGLPGVPLAIARPDLVVHLVEAQRRRVAFLEMVCDELRIANAVPVHARVDAFRGPVAVCFARAFAPLPRSWAAATRLLAPGGRLIYFAGASLDVAAEVRGIEPAPSDVWTAAAPPVVASAGPLVIMTLQ